MPPYTKYEGTFFFWFYLKHPVSKLLRTGKGRSCFGCKEKRCRHTLCLANRFDEADGHKMPFVRRMFSYGSRPLSGDVLISYGVFLWRFVPESKRPKVLRQENSAAKPVPLSRTCFRCIHQIRYTHGKRLGL